MTNEEYEFILTDRIAKIKAINEQYDLEHKSYISFSGGKDSCVLSRLIDMALPSNKIPRIYFNTGIEYKKMLDYVRRLASVDSRYQIINSGVNIKNMLEENGYPFKSKQHSHNWSVYNNFKGTELDETIKHLKEHIELQKNYDYIHNLPNGIKTSIKYIFGLREREREIASSMIILTCPDKLKYQFTPEFKERQIKFSDKCCYRLKKDVALRYEEESGKRIAITGIRGQEGGMRAINGCTIFNNGMLKRFHPIKVITDDFEQEFIKRENIKLCELYYPPYNFARTGCCACPYAIDLQAELNKLFVHLPNEYYKAIRIWKKTYDEYIRIGYRLKYYPHERGIQMSMFDILEKENDTNDN